MIKINEKYKHEGTGITFEVEFEHIIDNGSDIPLETKKKITILPSGVGVVGLNRQSFVLNKSKSEMITKIGRALLEIGEFCEKL